MMNDNRSMLLGTPPILLALLLLASQPTSITAALQPVTCPSNQRTFTAVTEMIFEGRTAFLSIPEGNVLVREFVDVYNGLTQSNCDAYFRRIAKVTLVNMTNSVGGFIDLTARKEQAAAWNALQEMDDDMMMMDDMDGMGNMTSMMMNMSGMDGMMMNMSGMDGMMNMSGMDVMMNMSGMDNMDSMNNMDNMDSMNNMDNMDSMNNMDNMDSMNNMDGMDNEEEDSASGGMMMDMEVTEVTEVNRVPPASLASVSLNMRTTHSEKNPDGNERRTLQIRPTNDDLNSTSTGPPTVNMIYTVTGTCRSCPIDRGASFELYDDTLRRRYLSVAAKSGKKVLRNLRFRTRIISVEDRALQEDDDTSDCQCVEGTQPEVAQAPGVAECVDLMNDLFEAKRIETAASAKPLYRNISLTDLVQLDGAVSGGDRGVGEGALDVDDGDANDGADSDRASKHAASYNIWTRQ